jgi:hypothetical protein
MNSSGSDAMHKAATAVVAHAAIGTRAFPLAAQLAGVKVTDQDTGGQVRRGFRYRERTVGSPTRSQTTVARHAGGEQQRTYPAQELRSRRQ